MSSRSESNHGREFFPPSGMQSMLFDIAGKHVELERPPRDGEHAHTVDDEARVMSIRFQQVCEDLPPSQHANL